MAFLAASSGGQQEDFAKSRLGTTLSPILAEFDASKLTGDGRRTYDVLRLIVEDVDAATTADQRRGYLQEFLVKSERFAKEQPKALQLWTLRAIAALELNQGAAGREACSKMIELKAGDMDDPRIRRVLAMLDRKGWYNPATDPKHPGFSDDTAQGRPGTFKSTQYGNSVRPISFDPHWTSYGAYLRRMLAEVQGQWDRILADSGVHPPSRSSVNVKFAMDSTGRVVEILDVASSSSDQGKQCCVSAITLTAPYGEWTDDMKTVLGKSQDITFQFIYQ